MLEGAPKGYRYIGITRNVFVFPAHVNRPQMLTRAGAAQVVMVNAWEARLHLRHVASGARRCAHLQAGWNEAPVREGDPINVVFAAQGHAWHAAEDGTQHVTMAADGAVLLVLHPDTLISSTSITAALRCPRQAMLQDRGIGAPSRAALLGNLMHALVQSALQALASGALDGPEARGPRRPVPVPRASAPRLLVGFLHARCERNCLRPG